MTSEEKLTEFANAVGTDIKSLYTITNVLNSFELNSIQDTDLIQYSSALGKWKNIRKETISDGGNF